MSIKPLVSVIIPAYNREELITRALDSALNQTYTDLEIIVIDDASTDKTVQIVKQFDDSRIKLIELDKNVGQCIARNVGIKGSTGQLIAFLDSDDEWLPNKIEKQVDCFQNSDLKKLGAVYCNSYMKDESTQETVEVVEKGLKGDLRKDILGGYCPPSPTLFLVDKAALIDAGSFDEGLPTFVDLDLWIRLSKNYTFDYVPEFLATKYEHGGQQMAKDIDRRLAGLKIFMSKWKHDIITIAGKQSYKNIRNGRLRALVEANLKSDHAKPRVAGFKCLFVLFKIPELKPRLYVKSLLFIIFGRNIFKRNTII